MKIIIRYKSDKGKTRGFFLYLPTFLIKTRLIQNSISKYTNKKSLNNISDIDEDTKEDIIDSINEIEETIPNINLFTKSLYKEIRKYIRKYGHFTFLEVNSNDAYVKIII